VKLVACLAFSAFAAVSLAKESPHPGYRLVWADEFEIAGKPNPKNWVHENGFRETRCKLPLAVRQFKSRGFGPQPPTPFENSLSA
jgi:hypothetical protein